MSDNTAAAVQRLRDLLAACAHDEALADINTLVFALYARDRNWDLLHDIEDAAINAGICESSGHALTDLVQEIPAAITARDKRIAELEAERDAAIRRERAAQEGRNLVVTELQRIQLELGIRCVGGEPTRNFRVRQERDGEPTCPKCRKPITTTDHHGILWVCCHCGWRGELQNADSRALQPRHAVADAGDTRECGCAQKCGRKDEGATGDVTAQVRHMEDCERKIRRVMDRWPPGY